MQQLESLVNNLIKVVIKYAQTQTGEDYSQTVQLLNYTELNKQVNDHDPEKTRAKLIEKPTAELIAKLKGIVATATTIYDTRKSVLDYIVYIVEQLSALLIKNEIPTPEQSAPIEAELKSFLDTIYSLSDIHQKYSNGNIVINYGKVQSISADRFISRGFLSNGLSRLGTITEENLLDELKGSLAKSEGARKKYVQELFDDWRKNHAFDRLQMQDRQKTEALEKKDEKITELMGSYKAVVAEKLTLTQERDTALQERNAAIQEKEALAAVQEANKKVIQSVGREIEELKGKNKELTAALIAQRKPEQPKPEPETPAAVTFPGTMPASFFNNRRQFLTQFGIHNGLNGISALPNPPAPTNTHNP
ncbi:hypothetical protein ACFORL_04970 [Legionella dresdenensis]|uniref:Uncharacterized protein n=1 Tax=Legionella dresdenensis TaxID=450200 RepID=A0ABV8CDY9_9GAMM